MATASAASPCPLLRSIFEELGKPRFEWLGGFHGLISHRKMMIHDLIFITILPPYGGFKDSWDSQPLALTSAPSVGHESRRTHLEEKRTRELKQGAV